MYIALRTFLVQKLKKYRAVWIGMEFLNGLLFVFEYFYYANHRSKTSIIELNIELVSYCNLRCKLCSLDHDKPKLRMNPTLLSKLFDELMTDRRFNRVEVINLHNAGDALLHPEFKSFLDIIALFKNRFSAAGLAFPKVYLLTNAMALTKEKTHAIIESCAIDKMRFSMDGGTAKEFERLRIRAKWEVFREQVMYFHAKNNERQVKIETDIISVIEAPHALNPSWMDKEFVEMLDAVDTYELRRPHDWAGEVSVDLGYGKNKFHKIGCGLMMRQLVVLPNGDITVCCNDLNSKGVIGNIEKERLFDLYNGHKRRTWLKHHLQKKKHKIDLCKNCETY